MKLTDALYKLAFLGEQTVEMSQPAVFRLSLLIEEDLGYCLYSNTKRDPIEFAGMIFKSKEPVVSEKQKLVNDLRAIAIRVNEASYATDASYINRLADNIESVFCQGPCPRCGK